MKIEAGTLQPDACKSPVGLREAYGAGSGTKDVRGHLRPPTPSLLGNGLRFQIVSASHMLAARALPGSVLNWMCAGLTNPNLAPREHMSLVAMRPMFFGVAAFAACCAGCATHKNDQTREIERTAGDYCQSKGQRLVKTTAGDSEVFNCVPDAPGTSGNAGIGAAKPVWAKEHAN